jgi:uncharacterized protein DUF4177
VNVTATKQYKVLTQNDRLIGKFSPESLEVALNTYAKEGWHFAAVATAEVKNVTGTKPEAIFVLERDV